MNGIHYRKILTSVVLTWDLKKCCTQCRWNDGHTNTCEAHLPLQKNLTNNVKTFFLVWCNIKIKSKATKFLLPSKTNSVSGMKYLKQFRGDKQQIVVARNMHRSYKLFIISRMPKMCAIPLLVLGSLNPIPILEHFRRSHLQREHN